MESIYYLIFCIEQVNQKMRKQTLLSKKRTRREIGSDYRKIRLYNMLHCKNWVHSGVNSAAWYLCLIRVIFYIEQIKYMMRKETLLTHICWQKTLQEKLRYAILTLDHRKVWLYNRPRCKNLLHYWPTFPAFNVYYGSTGNMNSELTPWYICLTGVS